MTVIEVAGAHKSYARWRRPPEKAVDGLDLVVEDGGVHGFLGPNGSGKTTTIRMLLGLVRPDAGRLTLLGRPIPQDLPQVIGGVGALVAAVVEPAAARTPVTAGLLRQTAAAGMSPSHRPRIWFTGDLPRTAPGKPARAEVVCRALAGEVRRVVG